MTGGRIILPPTNPSLDANGDPVSGAILTFYLNGTTTLTPVYTTAALSVPLANPLTADSAGLFPQIYADDELAYSVKWSRTGLADKTYDDIHTDHYGPDPTYAVLTSGTGVTYTTPAGAKQLRIRMVGGGGGGGGSGSGTPGNGTAGTDTSFNTAALNAKGGSGASGNANQGGAGGTAGAGTANFRTNGGPGASAGAATAAIGAFGGLGGSSLLGGGAAAPAGNTAGTAASANTGGGGSGAGVGNTAGTFGGGGGGAGEYVEYIINTPAASYTYTVGPGGVGGAAGTSGNAGGAGGSGVIIVEARF